ERTLPPSETSRTWFRQNPPLPRVMWSLRDNNNYEETGLLVSLSYFANNRHQLLENFYQKSKRSILKAHTEGPAAYILSAADPRPGAQAELLRILQMQHVEISRATAAFTAQVPIHNARAKRGGTADSSARASTSRAPSNAPSNALSSAASGTTPTETRQFPAGSYIVRMDQPYSRIADALLDYQFWSPNDPQKTPYDDTGWTFPENFDVQAVRVVDPQVLTVPMERVTDTINAPGGVRGTGTVFAINNNGDNALTTLRYRLREADFQAAEEPFQAAGRSFARGSYVIRNVSAGDLDRAARELGVSVYAIPSAPSVAMHPARAARVAILHTWSSTQTEGWWRQAFDVAHIPYSYINVQDVAKNPNLNAKYDVILFPPSGNAQSIVQGMPMWRNPMPWKTTPLTPNIGKLDHTDDIRPGLGLQGVQNLEGFVTRGGVLVAVSSTADFAIQYGLAS